MKFLEDLLENHATFNYDHLYKLFTLHGEFRGPPAEMRQIYDGVPFPRHLMQVCELLRRYKGQYRRNEHLWLEAFRENFEEAIGVAYI